MNRRSEIIECGCCLAVAFLATKSILATASWAGVPFDKSIVWPFENEAMDILARVKCLGPLHDVPLSVALIADLWNGF